MKVPGALLAIRAGRRKTALLLFLVMPECCPYNSRDRMREQRSQQRRNCLKREQSLRHNSPCSMAFLHTAWLTMSQALLLACTASCLPAFVPQADLD